MTLVSAISFLILALIVILGLRKSADVLSPAKVFGIIWSLSVGLADLKFSRLQQEWHLYGVLMLAISIGSFYLGIYIAYVLNFGEKFKSISEIRKSFSDQTVDRRKLFNIVVIVFLIYFLSFLGNYFIEGYLPIFEFKAAEARMQFGVFGIGLTIHLIVTLLLISVTYLSLVKNHTSSRIFVGIILAISFFSYLTLLQRFNLMFGIIISITFLYYTTNTMRLRNTFMFFSIMVGLMYSVQFVRLSRFAANFLYYMSEMKFDIKYAIFTEPYMYVVMNLENFTRATTKLTEHGYGFFTFNFLLSFSGMKHTITEYINPKEFPFLVSSYNTYSMFWDFYRDFGVFGISIIPILLGFLISSIYYKMRINPNIFYVALYCISMFLMFISFFENPIKLLHFIFTLSVIISLYIYIWKSVVIKSS